VRRPAARDSSWARALALLGCLPSGAARGQSTLGTVVRAPREATAVGATTVSADEGRRIPGNADDSLRALESAPGVARSPLGSGQLVVWGAAPQDTRVYIDEVAVPSLYHLGGLRSVLPTELVREVTLLPGGYGAEFGRALGGIAQASTQRPADGLHGGLALDVLDVSAQLSAQLGRRLRVRVAGRYSYLDALLQAVLAGNRDLGDFWPVPRYDDYQVQATLALRPGEQLSATFLAADDHLRRAHAASDAALGQSETWQRAFYRASLQYERRSADGMQLSITPFFGYDQADYTAAFGWVPSQLVTDGYRYGVRAHYRRRTGARLTWTVGLDGEAVHAAVARQGTLTQPPREGDRVLFGQPPGSQVNADSYFVDLGDLSPYATAELRLGKLTLRPGLRASGYVQDTSRLTPRIGETPAIGARQLAFALEPRLHAALKPTPRLTLAVAAGLYHQPPDPADLGAVFGNPRLGPSRAVHVTAGLAVTLAAPLSAELTGFYRYLDDLAARSPLTTPPLAGALTQDGRGQSYGAQLLVRLRPWRGLSGWLTYTLGRSERRDAPTLPVRLFDLDQTHILTAAASFARRGWGCGLRFRYATGFPRTPVVSAYFDARDDLYQPVYGAQNSIRLGDFVELDARVDRTFTLRRLTLVAYLEVQNVTNQKNPEELVYRYDFSSRAAITGLPTLAVLGVRLGF
jgi:hypothetical protein